MTAISDFQQWLDHDNSPDGPSEADELEQALRGRSGALYRAQAKRGGLVLVTGKGKKAFVFHRADTDKHIRALRQRFASEPGADWSGDEAFARGMAKDD